MTCSVASTVRGSKRPTADRLAVAAEDWLEVP